MQWNIRPKNNNSPFTCNLSSSIPQFVAIGNLLLSSLDISLLNFFATKIVWRLPRCWLAVACYVTLLEREVPLCGVGEVAVQRCRGKKGEEYGSGRVWKGKGSIVITDHWLSEVGSPDNVSVDNAFPALSHISAYFLSCVGCSVALWIFCNSQTSLRLSYCNSATVCRVDITFHDC